eukprot:COSAG01_NODE_1909_length_8928_cov_64.180315_9_plen_90_part_00
MEPTPYILPAERAGKTHLGSQGPRQPAGPQTQTGPELRSEALRSCCWLLPGAWLLPGCLRPLWHATAAMAAALWASLAAPVVVAAPIAP